jgi:heme oxygenase (biliverdin-IX-beta and delta-forming)
MGTLLDHPLRRLRPSAADETAAATAAKGTRIHVQLRQATIAAHRRLEERLDLLAPDLSRAHYRRMIEAFYGFYLPVEAGLARLLPDVPPLGFDLPRRHRLLYRDLLALGASANDVRRLPLCTALPPLSLPEHLGGCLYVIEGAALGGQIIARALARTLGMGSEAGAAFFAGGGHDTIARWRRVLGWLGEAHPKGDSSGEVVRAARETFDALGRWLEMRGAAR